MGRLARLGTLSALMIGLTACGAQGPEVLAGDGEPTAAGQGKADASAEAVFLDFEWDGELLTSSCWNANAQIENQALYTVGQLNGDNSVGRLDKLAISEVKTQQEGGACRVTYHARMPVAWGKKNAIPTRYELILPRDVSSQGAEAFTQAYAHDCAAAGAHDVTAGIFWYYYRPAAWRCKLDNAKVVKLTAEVSPSPIATTGKFPEYHKVWEDDAFKVVAVFGKYEDGATSGDAGIDAYDKFLRDVGKRMGGMDLVTEPANVPYNPGVKLPEVTFRGTLADGRTMEVVAILVDSVGTAPASFWKKYESLTPTADFIVYNGHAGLGSNIRKLARQGKWTPGQYTIVFMNGCDTYAYVDSALNDAHAEVNPDDPAGTKYVDVMANAMPSFFRSMSSATMAMIDGLLAYDAPLTYEQIFKKIDRSEVVLVTGEHDNEFTPGMFDDTEPDAGWEGLTETGKVARDEEVRVETPLLPAGRYAFVLTGTNDADLYVRLGDAPTTADYDCGPQLYGSDERCEVVLDVPTVIHAMVAGWAETSDFELVGQRVE